MDLVMRKFFLIIPLLFLICTGCASKKSLSWKAAMQNTIARYAGSVNRQFASVFHQAGVQYPPKRLAVLIFKQNKRLELYAKNRGSWRFIKAFPILAASGAVGPKLRVGDHQVPEGIYRISALNPRSRFDLSMKINYPNDFDRQQARADHRRALGGNIFIHGKNQSVGCVAIGDPGIEKLFLLVAEVGISNVQVIIAPDDMRRAPPIYRRNYPSWLPTLYRRITLALRSFPVRGSED